MARPLASGGFRFFLYFIKFTLWVEESLYVMQSVCTALLGLRTFAFLARLVLNVAFYSVSIRQKENKFVEQTELMQSQLEELSAEPFFVPGWFSI